MFNEDEGEAPSMHAGLSGQQQQQSKKHTTLCALAQRPGTAQQAGLTARMGRCG